MKSMISCSEVVHCKRGKSTSGLSVDDGEDIEDEKERAENKDDVECGTLTVTYFE